MQFIRHEHCTPIAQEIFQWGQLKTEMYWPTGQLNVKICFLLCITCFFCIWRIEMLMYLSSKWQGTSPCLPFQMRVYNCHGIQHLQQYFAINQHLSTSLPPTQREYLINRTSLFLNLYFLILQRNQTMEWGIIFVQRPLPLSFADAPTFLCVDLCKLTECKQELSLHKFGVHSWFNYCCGKHHLKEQTYFDPFKMI